MRTTTSLAAAVAVLSLAACSPRTAPGAPAAGAGKRLAEGGVLRLTPSPDGAALAWLADCAPAPGAGKGQAACVLVVAPAAGGAPRRVAEGVAAIDGSFAWGPDGSIAAMGRRDPIAGTAELAVVGPGGEPRVVSRQAAAFAWGPGPRLAFAAGGELHVLGADGSPATVRGGAGALAFAFAPSPGRSLAAVVPGAGGARNLAVWREAGEEPAVVASDVGPFAFSPDGATLAAIAGVAPGKAGDLVAVPLRADGKGPPAPVPVARGVGEFRWAPRAGRLAWLAEFDPRIRAGSLASAAPGGAVASLAPGVTSFELSPSGEQVAYVRHVTEGGYSALLELSPSQAAAGGTLARDPASFEFSPDGRWLYYRSACAPGGEACSLFRAPAAGLGAGQAPERLAEGVVAFAVDAWRPDRVLLCFSRRDGAAVDLALWSGGKLSSLDAGVLGGSTRFLAPDGRRVAYAVATPARAGVYVIDAP